MNPMTRYPGARRGAPAPPPELMAELMAAGKARDQLRITILEAQYRAWAKDRGWDDTPHSTQPDVWGD